MGRGTNDLVGCDTSFTILSERANEIFARIRENMQAPSRYEPNEWGGVEVPLDLTIYLAMHEADLSVHFPEPSEIESWRESFLKVYDAYMAKHHPSRNEQDEADLVERRSILKKPFDLFLDKSKEYHGV